MATTKMTRKGQVTIPAEIRAKLGLHEGDILSVVDVDGTVVLSNPAVAFRASLERIWEYTQGQPHVTADEIDDIVADAIVEDYLESNEGR